MTVLSTSLLLTAALLLTHSCYSAHEHSSLSPISAANPSTMPLDIQIETVIAALLALIGIVLSGGKDQLREIQQRVWMGRLEREKGAGPWSMLEERTGFLDIRERRREFREWAKGGK
ncbi:magnesium transporter [Pyronema omphalodes]|nr:magnesium transporter [Pyronema omphalodes]